MFCFDVRNSTWCVAYCWISRQTITWGVWMVILNGVRWKIKSGKYTRVGQVFNLKSFEFRLDLPWGEYSPQGEYRFLKWIKKRILWITRGYTCNIDFDCAAEMKKRVSPSSCETCPLSAKTYTFFLILATQLSQSHQSPII